MQRRYLLPVNAILQTLRDQNGITMLSASLPHLPGYQQEAGEVALILGQGRVHTCTIRAADGLPLLQGSEALKTLERLGSLEWHVQGLVGMVYGLPTARLDTIPVSHKRTFHAVSWLDGR